MMRFGASLLHQLVTHSPADETIEETVPVNVAGLLSMKEKAGPPQAMQASPHTRPTPHLSFDLADRAEPSRMKQAGRA